MIRNKKELAELTIGIEVKAGSTVNRNDFKDLQMIADSLPKKFKRGIILYGVEEGKEQKATLRV